MSFTGPGGQAPNQPNSRFSVVLGSSPHRPAFHELVAKHPNGAQPAVISDLSPQFKKQMSAVKMTPVPLPSIPGMPRPPQQQQVKRETTTSASTPVKPSASGTTTPNTGRGRPKGWKPGMSYAAMRGRSPRASKPKPGQLVGVVKRRGRPPKQASPPPRELYHTLNPPFLEFLCEWKGCKAELQNLETLQRHVNIVHLEEQDDDDDDDEGRWCCLWGKCGRRDPVPAFSGHSELECHVEEAHMEPFAWHVGDGPANSSGRGGVPAKQDEDEIPAYLKDADGNQVTPSIREQELEDYATWRENRRRLKRLLLERDRNLPSEDESDGPGEAEGLVA